MALLSTLREKIANRVFEIYRVRGGTSGHDLEDLLQAEREAAEAGSMGPTVPPASQPDASYPSPQRSLMRYS
jgi:hypothetical protein